MIMAAAARVPETASATATARPDITGCHILVVDDTDFNRLLIGTLLEDGGYHNIAYARDGVDALESMARQVPDLVILDIMMPGMDGYEVCRRLRADPALCDVPVLVQTALSSSDDRNQAFAVGTTDLITKPIERTELLARVGIHLENRVLIRDLSHYRARVEGELAVARSMQDHLLPARTALDAVSARTGTAIRVHSLPAHDMGADIWGVVALEGPRFGVYLLDMAGRGVTAALNAFRMHTLIHEPGVRLDDPAAFLTDLNRRAAALLDLGDHAALLYGVVDTGANRFTYAAAASMPPLVLSGGCITQGDAAGLPLGVAPGTCYESRTLPFPADGVLMLCSNAIHDALDAGEAGGGSGENGLSAVAAGVLTTADSSHAGFARMTTALEAALGAAPGDDHTFIWIDRSGGDGVSP